LHARQEVVEVEVGGRAGVAMAVGAEVGEGMEDSGWRRGESVKRSKEGEENRGERFREMNRELLMLSSLVGEVTMSG
jgi:hypothetical protein